MLRQISPESEHIYDFIIALHHYFRGDWKALQKEAGLSNDELAAFLDYSAQFLGNLGNFKSFGDSKFVPRLNERQLKALAAVSPQTLEIYEQIKDGVFVNKNVGKMHLGYPDQGHVSTYYPDSPDITKVEISIVSDFLEGKKLLPENTRLRKTTDGFEVLIASALENPGSADRDLKESEWELEGKLKGKKLKLVFGDYTKEMGTIAEALQNAKKYASNRTEASMMEEYVKSFRTGSLEAYKESQRYWIKDKGPEVETDIGFVEVLEAMPAHCLQGRVALIIHRYTAILMASEASGKVSLLWLTRSVRKHSASWSKLLQALSLYFLGTKVLRKTSSSVQTSPPLRFSHSPEAGEQPPLYPNSDIEILTTQSIPAGINIPNYDDIRQTLGFKNVSLGNVLSAKAPNESIPFIKPSDLSVYQRCRDAAFEVQVGLHELLGHGCGKLLQETSPGNYNFDINSPPINPLTGKPVTSWYKPGQTWGSVFGAMAGSYEECRAECVAMALSCDFGVLSIFGFGDGSEDIDGPAGDILYAAYLSMAHAGVAALEFWDPKSRKWGQAHMQARFSILRTFLNAGVAFCELESNAEDLGDLTIRLERSKILSLGRPAVEKYLQRLHIYKATADVEGGRKMYDEITAVDDWYATKLRPAVLSKKTPRKVFVQANTVIGKDGRVELREYEASAKGMIESFADRAYI